MWMLLGASTEPGASRAASARFWAIVLGAAAGLFLLGFLIGWFAKPTEKKTFVSPHEEVKAAFMGEMKAENIKRFL